MLFIFDDDFSTFSVFEASSNKRFNADYEAFVEKVIQSVFKPLNKLFNSFAGPNKLIEKRFDKLTDHEAALNEFRTKANGAIGNYLKEVWFVKQH